MTTEATESDLARAMLTVELINVAEELAEAVEFASSRPSWRSKALFVRASYLNNIADQEVIDRLRRFSVVYADELAVVRAARNQVVHARTLDTGLLEDAVQVGRYLVASLRRAAGADETSATA